MRGGGGVIEKGEERVEKRTTMPQGVATCASVWQPRFISRMRGSLSALLIIPIINRL